MRKRPADSVCEVKRRLGASASLWVEQRWRGGVLVAEGSGMSPMVGGRERTLEPHAASPNEVEDLSRAAVFPSVREQTESSVPRASAEG